jgi:hypothetical protein
MQTMHLVQYMDAKSISLGHPLPPVMARELFAQLIGLPVGVVVGWCNKGLIPTYDIGKYSLINVALLQKLSIQKDFT